MTALRRPPLVVGTIVAASLAGALWFGAPLLAGQAPSAAAKGQASPAQTAAKKPAPARPAVALPVPLRAERRGRLMQGGSQGDQNRAGVFDVQTDTSRPATARHPREERMRGGGTFNGDLRNLTPGAARRRSRPERAEPAPRPVPFPAAPAAGAPVSTQAGPLGPNLPAPGPIASFDGLDFATWGQGHPPDTNGDVGPEHYIQAVNSSVGIFRKSDGVRLAAFTLDTLMSQGNFGNACDTENFGDPVVVYDTFEDRWIITDFAFKLDGSGNVSPPASLQCFAVSKSGDPISGGWNFYSINTTGGLGDYPKFGIWPDGLYMSVNMFDYAAAGNFQNVRLYAFNKAQMYAGVPSIQVLSFDAPATEFTMLPSNARLQTGTPPAGSPNYFATVWNYLNVVGVWKFHVDWNSISTSTLTGPFNVLTPTSWSQLTGTGAPTPANTLDTLYPRLMVQNQYSNIDGVESLWDSHTVGASGTSSAQAAVRYYQLAVTGGAVAANSIQAFTHSPDATVNRFMVSTAVDRLGDMALGYSASSSTLNPSLRYAGRLAGDPANTITYEETTIMQGTGTQSGNCGGAPCHRWGDYSAMTLDVDGCTFWYTNEYYATSGLNNLTRIASFSFPECTPITIGTLQGTVRTTGNTPVVGAAVMLGSRVTTTDAGGVYTFANLPVGTYSALTASSAGFAAQTFAGISIAQNSVTTLDFTLAAAPASGCFVDTTQADFQTGIPTNCDLTASPASVTLVNLPTIDQQNLTVTSSGFGFSDVSWAGQTFTPTVSGAATRIDLNLFCSGCTGTTPNLTVSLRATNGSVPTGADLAVATIPGFASAGGGFYSAVFPTPATLTAGTRYAVIIRATSVPSPGVYAYVCSCTSPNSNPYANGQRVTSANSGVSWSADTTVGGRDFGFEVFMSSGFTSPGTFVSSIKDANPAPGATVAWGTLSWNASVPAGTTLQFQAAASNSVNGPFNFVGPDGTAATFFSNGGSLAQFGDLRYVRYKAVLSTSSGSATPTINDVTVCFGAGNPAPAITTLSPASVVAGSGGFTLTVTGTGLVNGSVVRVDGADRATTFGATTQVTAAMLSADSAAPTTHTITVFNPAPGGGTSNGLTLTVTSAAAHTPSVTNANTDEDMQSTSGLVVTRNAADGTEVTHFKITGISGGTLFKADGTTPIGNNAFIAVAEGTAGLKFTPTANLFSPATTFGFTVQGALDSAGTGLGGGTTASVTVTPIADTPAITAATTNEDTRTTTGLVVTRNAADGVEVTHVKITGITGGTLFQANGTTPIVNNDIITFAQAGAGLRFMPAANAFSPGGTFGFQVAAATDVTGAGLSPAAAAAISVNAVADAPGVTSATTTEDAQTTSGLVLSRNAVDGAEVTHFKITGITNGRLFKNNGSTVIANNTIITFAEGNAGLKFTPASNLYGPVTTFGFTTQGATGAAGTGLGPAVAVAITVTPLADAPTISPATTSEDTQSSSGLIIARNAADGAEVTHFKITGIVGGALFQADGTSPISSNAFITVAEGSAGLKFTPLGNLFSPTTTFGFTAQGALDNAGTGLSAGTAASVTVTARADTPSITNATTNEDVQTSSGLVVTRNAVDGVEVAYVKVTGITNGTLFQADGTTPIALNDVITFAQAGTGLRFTPAANTFSPSTAFSVQVAGATDAGGGGVGPAVTATITVTPVADPPGITPATTIEDTKTASGLVISRGAGDGAEVTHFKITNITNGTLFKSNGTTVIANNTIITFAEGSAGLKFTPVANASSPGTVFSFQVQGATSVAGAGLSAPSTATITVTPMADLLSVTGATTVEDVQTTSGLVITRNAADGDEITHVKITALTNGTLFQNDGTTPILTNAVITFAEANAGLKFKPVANWYTPTKTFSFKVQGATSAAGAGLGPLTTATITVTPVADPPAITAATTNEDTQSSTGLVITRNVADGAEVTHLKITGITGGTLFQADGTTPIADGGFITLAAGNAGLKFTPSPNSFASGTFMAQATLDNTGTGLSAGTVVSIKVNAVADTPAVTNAVTNQDTKTATGLVISRNPVDGVEVAYFKITNITNGALFQSNGTTAIANNSFVTFAQGSAGLKFMPGAGLSSPGTTFSFDVQGATSSAGAGLGGAATATITVNATADVPTVTGATTVEDVQTTSGLVISRNAADGPEVTHFKITAITNGTLFQNDGTTPIVNNTFITFGQGNVGLRFKPAANAYSPAKGFSFKVQGATSAAGAGLSAIAATATITVTPVADPPTITAATTNEDTQTTTGLVITRASVDGAEVTHLKITGITNGLLFQHDGTTSIANGAFITLAEGNAGLRFTPAPDSIASGSFTAQSALDSSGTGLSTGKVVSITVTAVADTPSVTNATTTQGVQTTSGLVITRNAVDGAEVKYFKITNILNGALFQSNGTTPVANDTFITVAQGAAGLKFTPAAGVSSPGTVFSFGVQAATTATGGGLSAGSATATITVNGIPVPVELAAKQDE